MFQTLKSHTLTTSRKVAGSIPGGVIGIFHWLNPSIRPVSLGSTQPLTEMSTRNISWGWRRSVCRTEKLSIFLCVLSWNLETSTCRNSSGRVIGTHTDFFTFCVVILLKMNLDATCNCRFPRSTWDSPTPTCDDKQLYLLVST